MFGLKMVGWMLLIPILLVCSLGCGQRVVKQDDPATKLAEWRKGVWLAPDGSYSVYTDTHYFVFYLSGDSANINLYCGASQIAYHTKGMARNQVLRARQLPGQALGSFVESAFQPDNTEKPLVIDTLQFAPGTCNVVDGIIYDSITEETDEYILLSSCGGDKIKIFSDSRSAYMPASGGEFYSYRVENLR